MRDHRDAKPSAPCPEDNTVQQEERHGVLAQERPDPQAEQLSESGRVICQDEDAHHKEPSRGSRALVLVAGVVVPSVGSAVVEVRVNTYIPDVEILGWGSGDVSEPFLHAASKEKGPRNHLAFDGKLGANPFRHAKQSSVSLWHQRNTLFAPRSVLENNVEIGDNETRHEVQVPRLSVPREKDAEEVEEVSLPVRLDLVCEHCADHARPSSLYNDRNGPEHTGSVSCNQRRLIRRRGPPEGNE